MRRAFDEDLEALQNQMLELGSMVAEALARSVDALKRQDMEASRQVIRNDPNINEKRFAIEADCLRLIATQQPMARDLRSIAAVLEIITDLERCADYAAGIAKIALMIGKEPFIKPLIDIPRMLEKDLSMLDRALKAFVERDVEGARRIAAEDDEVDALYDQVNNELITFMLRDPRTIQQATRLLWVAHNLERFADRVTNICERVVFTVTGEMREMNIQEPEVEPQ
ncbi:MAG: phosphate signaling complex protein PhoU [Chloroflexi bacterium]|nr:phosphate signaling complex protein PhoU [Chloroflexota bacterium]